MLSSPRTALAPDEETVSLGFPFEKGRVGHRLVPASVMSQPALLSVPKARAHQRLERLSVPRENDQKMRKLHASHFVSLVNDVRESHLGPPAVVPSRQLWVCAGGGAVEAGPAALSPVEALIMAAMGVPERGSLGKLLRKEAMAWVQAAAPGGRRAFAWGLEHTRVSHCAETRGESHRMRPRALCSRGRSAPLSSAPGRRVGV